MKAVMLIFMLCLMSSTMESTQPISIPLSMMDQSVDDMYSSCTEDMKKKVLNEYLEKEIEGNELFKNAWTAERSTKVEGQQKLTKNHLQALYVYTNNTNYVFSKFNAAVRDNASNYNTTFQYHALHFWLTSAIQILNPNQHCNITYRRTNIGFTGNVSHEIRFGQFASTSTKPDIKKYGNKTCFYIETCYGAYIKEYSVYPKEEEVLIPPYEKFNITNTGKGSVLNIKGLEDCETIFVLKSLGHLSKLNCTAI